MRIAFRSSLSGVFPHPFTLSPLRHGSRDCARLRDKASAVTHSPRHTSPPRNHRRQDVLPAMIKLDSPGFGWIYPDSALLTQADPRFPPPVSASPRAHVSREQVGSGRMRNATAFPEPSRSADRMEAGASIYLDSAFLPQAGPRFPTTRAPFVMSASLTRTAWIWLDLLGLPWISIGVAGFSIFRFPLPHPDLPGFTWIYLDYPGLPWITLDFLGSTRTARTRRSCL